MKTKFTRICTSILLFFALTLSAYAQQVSGTVSDENGVPLPGATVVVEGTSTGVSTDFDGNYSITSDMDTPFTIEASSVGFKAMSAEVSSSSTVNFVLEDNTALDEVVVSASRTPQRIFESPVTIERFGIKDIATNASADFYDGLEKFLENPSTIIQLPIFYKNIKTYIFTIY